MNSVTVNGHIYTDDSDPTTGLANGGHRKRLVPMLADAVMDLAAKVTAAETAQNSAEAVLLDAGLIAVIADLAGPNTIGTVAGIAAAVVAAALNMSAIIDAPTQAAIAAAAAQTALNAPGTSATSTTSLDVGKGPQILAIQTGKSLVKGMWIVCADTLSPETNYMSGPITSYDGVTGALAFTAITAEGSGTIAAWTVSLTAVGSTGISSAKIYFMGAA